MSLPLTGGGSCVVSSMVTPRAAWSAVTALVRAGVEALGGGARLASRVPGVAVDVGRAARRRRRRLVRPYGSRAMPRSEPAAVASRSRGGSCPAGPGGTFATTITDCRKPGKVRSVETSTDTEYGSTNMRRFPATTGRSHGLVDRVVVPGPDVGARGCSRPTGGGPGRRSAGSARCSAAAAEPEPSVLPCPRCSPGRVAGQRRCR